MIRTIYWDHGRKILAPERRIRGSLILIKAASLMIAREAMSVRVIGKRFDNSTVPDLTASADLNHALKFQLQRRESSHALVHFVQVSARNLSDRFTTLPRLSGQH